MAISNRLASAENNITPVENITDITSLNFERIDSGKDRTDFTSLNGETVTVNTIVKLEGISTTLENATLTIKVDMANLTEFTMSNIGQPVEYTLSSDKQYKTATISLGTIQSGTTIKLPLVVKSKLRIPQATEIPITATLSGSNPNTQTIEPITTETVTVIANYTEEVQSPSLYLSTNSLEYKSIQDDPNDPDQTRKEPYIGIWNVQTDDIREVATRTYNLNYDPMRYSGWNSSYVGLPPLSDYQLRLKIPETATLSSIYVPPATHNPYYLEFQLADDGYYYVQNQYDDREPAYDGYFSGRFELTYNGKEKFEEPWNIELSLVKTKTKEVVSKTTYSHENPWIEYNPNPGFEISSLDIMGFTGVDIGSLYSENGSLQVQPYFPLHHYTSYYDDTKSGRNVGDYQEVTVYDQNSLKVESGAILQKLDSASTFPAKLTSLEVSLAKNDYNLPYSDIGIQIIIPDDFEAFKVINPLTSNDDVYQNKNLMDAEILYKTKLGEVKSLGRLDQQKVSEISPGVAKYITLLGSKISDTFVQEFDSLLICWGEDTYYSGAFSMPSFEKLGQLARARIQINIAGQLSKPDDLTMIFGAKNTSETGYQNQPEGINVSDATKFRSTHTVKYANQYTFDGQATSTKELSVTPNNAYFYPKILEQSYGLRNHTKKDTYLLSESPVLSFNVSSSHKDMSYTIADSKLAVLIPAGVSISNLTFDTTDGISAPTDFKPSIESIEYNYKNSGMDLYNIKTISDSNIFTAPSFSSNPNIGMKLSVSPSIIPDNSIDQLIQTKGIYIFIDKTLNPEASENLAYYNNGFWTWRDIFDLNNNGDVEEYIDAIHIPYNVIVPEAVFVYNENSNDGGLNYRNDTSGLVAGELNPFQTIIYNRAETDFRDITVITTIPKKDEGKIVGEGLRGSQFDTTLAGPVLPPIGWSVLYTTTPQISNNQGLSLTDWVEESQISDWTKVTAIKYISNSDEVLSSGERIVFPFVLKTPETAKPGQSIVSTSAITTNNSTQYLEGYRSISKIQQYPAQITGKVFFDKDNNAKLDIKEGDTRLAVTLQLFYADGETPVLDLDGNPIKQSTSFFNDYSIIPPYGDTDYTVKVVQMNTYKGDQYFPKDIRLTSDVISITRDTPNGTADFIYLQPYTVTFTPFQAGTDSALLASKTISTNFVNDVYDTTNSIPNEIKDYDNRIWVYKGLRADSAAVSDTITIDSPITISVRAEYELKKGGGLTIIHRTTTGIDLETELVSQDEFIGSYYYVGGSYKSVIKDNDGNYWRYSKHDETSALTNGQITDKNQTIVFLYEPISEVEINISYYKYVTFTWVNEDGKIYEYQDLGPFDEVPSITIKTTVDTDYNVESYKKQYIRDTDGSLYEMVEKWGDSEKGTTGSETLYITYTYRLKKTSSVSVTHQTTDGLVLIPEKNIVEDVAVGSNYETTHEETLTDENGKVWQYSGLSTDSAPATGTVTEQPQKVVYEYVAKVGGQVIAKYVDESGQELVSSMIVSPANTQVGTVYTATKPSEVSSKGLVYVLKTIPTNESGRVVESTTEVVYVYTAKVGGDVSVVHVTDSGLILIEESLIADDIQVGSSYTSPDAKAEITDENGKAWQYSGLATDSAPATGTVTEQPQKVVYEYVAKAGGQVIAKYVDESGQELVSSVIVSPANTQVGTVYTATKPSEVSSNGLVYVLKTIPTNESGRVVEGTTEVVYVYTAKVGGAVTAKYVDTAGMFLLDPTIVVPSGSPIGTRYLGIKNEELTINGLLYRLIGLPKNESGIVTEIDQTILYVYTPVQGKTVTVVSKTVDGIILEKEKTVVSAAQTGSTYNSPSPKLEITDENGKVWQYLGLATDSAPVIGTVTEQTQKVVYEYVAKAGGQVIAKYMDKLGNILLPPVTVISAGSQVGTRYIATKDEEFMVNGLVYHLVSTPINEQGTVSENDQIVVYLYELISKPTLPIDSEDVVSSPPVETQRPPVYPVTNRVQPSYMKHTVTPQVTTLPMTGDKSDILVMLLGTLGLSMTGLLYVSTKKQQDIEKE